MNKKLFISLFLLIFCLSFNACYDSNAGLSGESGYSVIYNGNGNTQGSVPTDSVRYKDGDTVTIAGNTGSIMKNALALSGWNTKADGTGIAYTEGQTFTMGSEDVTLYAVWSGWTRQMGVPAWWWFSNTEGYATAADSSGNSFVTGTTYGPLDGELFYGWQDAFVVKYATDGTKQWTRLLNSGSTIAYALGYGIAVDSSDNIYVTGVTFDPFPYHYQMGNEDVFVVKLDKDGNILWINQLGVPPRSGTATTIGYAIAVDSSGNSYVTGVTYGALDGKTNIGRRDAFIIKFDSDGNKQWTRLNGITVSDTYGYGICVDTSGNAYITGYTNKISSSLTYAFISKYDTNGNEQWTNLTSVPSTFAYGISFDSINNCFCITGYTTGTLSTLTGQTRTGLQDVFVSKYSIDGILQWSRQTGAKNLNTAGRGICIDPSGNVYVTGETNGALSGQTLTGIKDVFAVEYDKDGNKIKTKQMGASGFNTFGCGIASDSSGKVYVGGYTYGALDGQTKATGADDVFVTSRFNE